MRARWLIGILLALVGCAAPRADVRDASGSVEPADDDSGLAATLRARAVHRAQTLVGADSLRTVSRSLPDDCTGFVRWVYEPLGIQLEGSSADMYRETARAHGVKYDEPAPGDLVFFRNTYDRNRDGKKDDGLTHVGIVESVDSDGTVTFVHRGHQGIYRSHLNLSRPRTHQNAQGRVLNDYLIRSSRSRRAFVTGELFAAYGSLPRLPRSR